MTKNKGNIEERTEDGSELCPHCERPYSVVWADTSPLNQGNYESLRRMTRYLESLPLHKQEGKVYIILWAHLLRGLVRHELDFTSLPPNYGMTFLEIYQTLRFNKMKNGRRKLRCMLDRLMDYGTIVAYGQWGKPYDQCNYSLPWKNWQYW